MSVFAPLSLCCRRLQLHLLFSKWGTSAGFINTTFADSEGLFQQICLWDWPCTLHGFLCNTQILRLSYKRRFGDQAWQLDPTEALARIMQPQAIESYSCCAGSLLFRVQSMAHRFLWGLHRATWTRQRQMSTTALSDLFFSSAFCILPKSCSLISSRLT